MDTRSLVTEIRKKANISQQELAQIVGSSLISIHKWEQGTGQPSPAQLSRLKSMHESLQAGSRFVLDPKKRAFSSRGVKRGSFANTLFDHLMPRVQLSEKPHPPVLKRITRQNFFSPDGRAKLQMLLDKHCQEAESIRKPPPSGISAGKNTYTYDAHTYHTKVPPQGIAELISYYLPNGGLILDPFAGSGMTGVACNVLGYDSILNELSPAACFIANRFTSAISSDLFEAGVRAILTELDSLRRKLYTTTCRECGEPVEILYTVWSYYIICHHCAHEFRAWNHCRRYGRNVKEHKILSSFPCPNCQKIVVKGKAQRTTAEPVMIVYKCCQKEYKHHPLNPQDRELVTRIEQESLIDWQFAPLKALPDGVNLRQPKKHGLNTVDKFYTSRNLAAMSQLWRTIHHVDDPQLAAFLAFAFTSLYQRVTRLAEFRFWGGSGNMARFNVPFVFKEANVFDTFHRKARSIQDHLQTTASRYHADSIVVKGSATRYSITTSAGAKIQPYFDVPPPSDPNLYFLCVQGEELDNGLVRIWVTEATARELKNLLGDLSTPVVSSAIIQAARETAAFIKEDEAVFEVAVAIIITVDAYTILIDAFPGVSDEHMMQLLMQHLMGKNSLA